MTVRCAPVPDPFDAEGSGLDLQAWRAQYRNPEQAAHIGLTLAREGRSAAWRGRGWFHVAFARPRGAAPVVDTAAVEQALAAAAEAQDTHLDIRCLILQAEQLRRAERHAEALAVLDRALERDPGAEAGEAEGYTLGLCLSLASMTCLALGQLDRALQLRYRSVSQAETLADRGPLANALGNLGGLQNDLVNLEDGLACSERAVEAAEAAGMQGSPAWFAASCNLAIAHLQNDDPPPALATARRMQALQAKAPPGKRGRYEVMWAVAALTNGLHVEARSWLDSARARWKDEAEVLIEWYVARAMLDNQSGRHAEARAICDRARAITQSGGDEVLPIDLWQLCDEGVRACRQLGDLEAALVYMDESFRQYELMAGRSARARRVTAEIQHGLDLARLARDEALRRREAAEAEQQRLAEVNEVLRQTSETRSRFLAAASHDLRQPLHALSLQTAHLAKALEASPHREAVARMGLSVASLTGMFDSLLDLSHIEAGAVEPLLGPVHLASLLLPLIEEHRPEAEQRGLRLALRCPEAARSMCIHSDAVLLANLLRNLIGNALKYTPKGGVLVALRRRPVAAGAARWRLQVIDTGVGIAEADRARIFEAFYQVANPDRSRARGLGLGLSIVQRLSVLLGHPLHLASTPGRGSCFGIEFDAVSGEASPGPDTRLRAEVRAGLRLAVAEDDDETRHALVDLLEGLGCEVLAAPSGDALLQQLGELTGPWPEALITDYRMPGRLDGVGLARCWRDHQGEHAPVLVLSADSRIPSLLQPDIAWFGKPVQEDRLRDWLGRL